MQQLEFLPDPKMKPKHDPGGKVKLSLKAGITGSALFGGRKNEYRYRLDRVWEPKKKTAMFVLMNPSTAEADIDDNTIAKCCRFATAWGYGGIVVANTFAYRCTDQKRLVEHLDPVGPDNDTHILRMAREASVVIFAYGKPRHKHLRSRGREVADMLVKNGIKPHVLKLSNDGTPCHPLYLLETLRPVLWQL